MKNYLYQDLEYYEESPQQKYMFDYTLKLEETSIFDKIIRFGKNTTYFVNIHGNNDDN